MAQGFKPAKASSSVPNKSKAKQTKAKASPKVGARICAPKKGQALKDAIQKRKNTASTTSRIEADMANRASRGGPLTIMKKAGMEEAERLKIKKKGSDIRAKASVHS